MTVDSKYLTESYLRGGDVRYPFFLESVGEEAILVYKVLNGVYTLLTEGFHYNLEFNDYRDPIFAGGEITTVAPLEKGAELLIRRKTPIETAFSISDGNPFPTEQFEYTMDKATFILQELEGTLCDCRGQTVTGQPAPGLDTPDDTPIDINPACIPYECSAIADTIKAQTTGVLLYYPMGSDGVLLDFDDTGSGVNYNGRLPEFGSVDNYLQLPGNYAPFSEVDPPYSGACASAKALQIASTPSSQADIVDPEENNYPLTRTMAEALLTTEWLYFSFVFHDSNVDYSPSNIIMTGGYLRLATSGYTSGSSSRTNYTIPIELSMYLGGSDDGSSPIDLRFLASGPSLRYNTNLVVPDAIPRDRLPHFVTYGIRLRNNTPQPPELGGNAYMVPIAQRILVDGVQVGSDIEGETSTPYGFPGVAPDALVEWVNPSVGLGSAKIESLFIAQTNIFTGIFSDLVVHTGSALLDEMPLAIARSREDYELPGFCGGLTVSPN